MQGDLISRSEILKWIPFWGGDIESMIEYIANMETAYDVEVVVSKMEKAKLGGRCDAGVVAIEIVRNAVKE